MFSTLLAVSSLALYYRLLGLTPESARQIERMRLAFATGWPLALAVGLIALAAVWFAYHYWKDGTRPSWWFKGPMVVLRLLAVAVLMVMLAQPTLRLQQVSRVRPAVVLLVDNSQSMGFTDPRLPTARAQKEAAGLGLSPADVPRMTRLDRANGLLNRSHLLAALARLYNVRLYTFAGAPHATPLPGDSKKLAAYRFALAPDARNGNSTQMGAALRRALEDLAGQPVAGTLILSDGGSNLGEDPVPVAAQIRQARIPVSTVGLGDPTKTKDVALLSVLADDVVRTHNTVTVYAALTHRGYAGKTVAVTLQRGNEVVGREMVVLGPDEQKQEVRFNYVAEQPGRFTYTVSIAPQPGEITLENNKSRFPQTVIQKKLKILYVENEPRYEYRYLKNAILRDTSLDFACLLLSSDYTAQGGEGNLKIHAFPPTEKALFDYDMVILGDVPRSYFTAAQLQALRRFVEDRGASLLVIAGDQHMPHEYAGTPLEAVLPVVITPAPDPILTEEPFQWQLTPEGRRSPITQLEDDPALNTRVWATLPGMYWAAGVPRAKPGATVLAVHPTRSNADGPRVLVATQPFGAGKCFIQLVDSTYLWRWRVGDRYFYRYWGQVLRTLTPKELPGNSRFVQLNADRNRYLLGDRALLTARLLDAFYHPIKARSVTAIIQGQGGQTQRLTLQATPGSPGLYTAQFQPDRVGRYEVSLTSPINPKAKASAVFVVESLALEKQKPELDEALLKRVAAAGGGKYYQPDELLQWARSLPNNPLTIRSEQEIELWDAPLFLILFITPLALEWLLRKRKGLL
ncbi:MAG TPA: hypothetical protein VFB38_18185 [Chthonomonadaceae bacterium]|nr:hypothetical protein [Chthonomonadaceae bacterium]